MKSNIFIDNVEYSLQIEDNSSNFFNCLLFGGNIDILCIIIKLYNI
jgi:hypothetical protein